MRINTNCFIKTINNLCFIDAGTYLYMNSLNTMTMTYGHKTSDYKYKNKKKISKIYPKNINKIKYVGFTTFLIGLMSLHIGGRMKKNL